LVSIKGSYYGYYEDVHSLYLDLLKKGNCELLDAAEEIITNCPTHTMLIKIVSVINNNPARYEFLLEQKNSDEMLRYLQKTERMPEALELIKRRTDISDRLLNEFFKLQYGQTGYICYILEGFAFF